MIFYFLTLLFEYVLFHIQSNFPEKLQKYFNTLMNNQGFSRKHQGLFF